LIFGARSLLVRTATTVALALLLLVFISLGAAAWFVAMPIAKQSTDDLSALMFLSAQTWRDAAEAEYPGLRQRFLQDYELIVAKQAPDLPVVPFSRPYFSFLEDSLSKRAGEKVEIRQGPNEKWLWVDIPVHDGFVRMGFDYRRMETRPPTVLLLVIIGGGLLTLLTSIAVVHRIIGPLDRLSFAVREVGQGNWPEPLAEDGPKELAALARAFNRMSSEVQALLENRTVMVAGISHDLRTPLTRLGLAVEMLDEESDSSLLADIRRDLAAMEEMIRQFMELAQGLGGEAVEEVDLWELLKALAADLQRQGYQVQLAGDGPCLYKGNPFALERILSNLIDNAARYAGNQQIDMDLQRYDHSICIRICDRGPGIPTAQKEAVFRPFYRVETARSVETGGSGLGLAIVSQLATRYGWNIDLLPREGGGTEALFELPLAG